MSRRHRSVIIGGVAAYELVAITTRRLPTVSEQWATHRNTRWRWFLMWVTGWVVWHLWGEESPR